MYFIYLEHLPTSNTTINPWDMHHALPLDHSRLIASPSSMKFIEGPTPLPLFTLYYTEDYRQWESCKTFANHHQGMLAVLFHADKAPNPNTPSLIALIRMVYPDTYDLYTQKNSNIIANFPMKLVCRSFQSESTDTTTPTRHRLVYLEADHQQRL